MGKIHMDDAIAAIASPVGEGGISVIRVSGPQTFDIVSETFRPQKGSLANFTSHTIHYGRIVNENNETIDQVLVSIFRKPRSFTGEDTIEISSHGGYVVTRHILNLLIQKGARHAEPGEFTKRAFMNGKIDLTQAEAVLDLVKARSEKSLETAIRQLTGSLSQRFKWIKDELMKMYAHMEAFLDFPEEDLEIFDDQRLSEGFVRMEEEISRLISSFKRGTIMREGTSVVIVGKPNVGKSSLFNALLARDRALVSDMPGTTRDALEEAIEIDGLYIRLMDSAGIASGAEHLVDQMGIDRARETLRNAQFVLYVVDGSIGLDDTDRLVYQEVGATKPKLILVNKCDLALRLNLDELEMMTGHAESLRISSKTRKGFDLLEKRISEMLLKGQNSVVGEQITRLRHKNALEKALSTLKCAKASFLQRKSLEFVIIDLKTTLDEMKELIGEVYSEDLLDVIFSEFCIGK